MVDPYYASADTKSSPPSVESEATVGPTRLHPPITLLDRDGNNVLESQAPVSPMRTCGACHDTAYISDHCYHAWLGLDPKSLEAGTVSGHSWDAGEGGWGRWNPLLYRQLTLPGDSQLDLGIADWIRIFGWRHPGGGPAVTGFGKTPLDRADAESSPPQNGVDPNRQVLDTSTRKPIAWDWQASGVVELNCFLCHTKHPDNEARVAELGAGRFAWAATATLAGSGVVSRSSDKAPWTVDPSKLTEGQVSAETLGLGVPQSENCGACHGKVWFSREPLMIELSPRQWSTATKGQVFSPQRISESAVNLKNREKLARPWDVHAQAILDCRSCHFSLNDPAMHRPSQDMRPRHLRFDPRRITTEEFLQRPSHDFAKGSTAQGRIASHLTDTMRSCRDCHDAASTHQWLPYRRVHFDRLACEACHIPRTYAPALASIDWTTIDEKGHPRITWRGIEHPEEATSSVVTGFEPVLLPRTDQDGKDRLTPVNLVAAWYWMTGGDAPRPVRLADLQAAVRAGDGYHPDILAVLDTNQDGRLDEKERVLDTAAKVEAVRKRLEAVGIADPKLVGEAVPFELHHGVGRAEDAVKDCESCHHPQSAASRVLDFGPEPYGSSIALSPGTGLAPTGTFKRHRSTLTYRPEVESHGYYLLGHSSQSTIDIVGLLLTAATLLGVAVHAGRRIARTRTSGKFAH
ncbi:methanogenesis multiheme c-type cytochrome [Thermostilla marina]